MKMMTTVMAVLSKITEMIRVKISWRNFVKHSTRKSKKL
jgi:hypothetical protein